MAERVVVTGGAGFIGSHVVDALVARGDDVHVVDDLSSGTRERVNESATLHVLDIADHDVLLAFATEHGPFARWYHLAAQADVRVSVANPTFDARVNVLGTIAVLAAAAVHEAPIIFSSTGGAIYGEVLPPTDETAPARPMAQYGTAKLAAEHYIAQHARLYDIPHVVLRFGNVYGPRQDPHGEAGVVAIFGNCALEGRAARVFGDGLQTRDYVFVDDVVDAMLRAAEVAADGGDVELRASGDVPIYNVGSGVETNVIDLWTTLAHAAGADPQYGLEPMRPGELQRSALDASRAREVLGVALDTPLDVGIARTIAWLERDRAGT